MEAPPPARTTVRGFHGTPVTSGDEDSDGGVTRSSVHGTPSKKETAGLRVLDDVVSANCSPVLRSTNDSPVISGISKLRMQMEPLSLDTSSTSSRAASPLGRARRSAQPSTRLATTTMSAATTAAMKKKRPTSTSSRSRVTTSGSSRSASREAPSSHTSGDETGPEGPYGPAAASYVIRLQNDFVSESVERDTKLATAQVEQGIFGGDDGENEDDEDEIELDGVPSRSQLAAEAAASSSGDASGAADSAGNNAPADAKPKKMTSDDFEPLRCLGKGSYGTVLLVKQHSTGKLYAQKQFKKASLVVQKKLVEQTRTERQILELVNRHPFVVKLYYAFQDREKLYLILEYGQGGELFTHLQAEHMFNEPTAAFYMAEMVLALSYLHDTLGVVYRDLKPENCLLDADGHLLLTDFGLSKVALSGTSDDDSGCCNSMLGTVEYMAPEVVLGKSYGRAVDWWSLGALGHDLLTGNPPFRGSNKAKIQENITKQKLVLPYFLTPDARDLLTRLLRKEPRKRLGANMPKDLTIIKSHRFFRTINWSRLAARQVDPPIQPVITDPALAENFSPEFTELALSPVLSPMGGVRDRGFSTTARGRTGAVAAAAAAATASEDPFGGFSFVASTSLLEESPFLAP